MTRTPVTEAPHRVPKKLFSEHEHQTWTQLYAGLEECRRKMAVPEFGEGLSRLGIDGSGIPDLDKVNNRLSNLTGWRGIPVEGLEEAKSFFPMMAERTYPIGWFIRDPKDLNYTPAPDVFHDLYGHLPFLANERYADFCAEFGKRGCRYLDDMEIVRQFERLFWFTAEFGLLQTHTGNRIFGGGIISSRGECYYALGKDPHVVPFDLNLIRSREYRVDVYQQTLFLLPDRETLFDCLDEFESLVKKPF